MKGHPAPHAQHGLRDRRAQGSQADPRSRPSRPALAPTLQRAAGEPTATPGPLSRPPGTSSQRSTVWELVPACVTDRVSPPHHRRSASPPESRPCYSCVPGQEQSQGHAHKTHAESKCEAQETGRCCRSWKRATGRPASLLSARLAGHRGEGEWGARPAPSTGGNVGGCGAVIRTPQQEAQEQTQTKEHGHAGVQGTRPGPPRHPSPRSYQRGLGLLTRLSPSPAPPLGPGNSSYQPEGPLRG